MEKMKAYFCLIKRLQPRVSEEANTVLGRYYQLQRQSSGRNAARTTIRMLESLSRLAEAHAKLMYREQVTIEDAVVAVSVMECSMQGAALLGEANVLHTSFPEDPCQQYQLQCQMVLEGLRLPDLLNKEMDRFSRNDVFLSNRPPRCATTTKTNSKESTGREEREGHSGSLGEGIQRKERRQRKTREEMEPPAPEDLVVQRVSRKLRNKRLKELEGRRRMGIEEGRQTAVENKSRKCYATDSEQTSPSANALLDLQAGGTAASGKRRRLTNNELQETGVPGDPGILDHNKPLNMMAAGSKKKVTTAVNVRTEHQSECDGDLRNKLSGFTFNPKAKMTSLRPLSSNLHTEFGSGLNTETRMHPDPNLIPQFHTNGPEVHLSKGQRAKPYPNRLH
ncbi:hypothetical protein CRUP_023901 [Coryphaenoides rupestris]|nr:hypothetical protein CRUP_023901 [Coryphaenoides rupestris]